MSTDTARAPVRDTVRLVPIVGNPRYTVALMHGTRAVGQFQDWLVAEAAMVGYVVGVGDADHE